MPRTGPRRSSYRKQGNETWQKTSSEQEIDCSTFAIDITGRLHWVIIFRDRTGHQTAGRMQTQGLASEQG